MKTLCVIPARGGSKGVPRKNLQSVAGVPLVVRAVRTALTAKTIDRVAVTTDDAEIAAVARDAGAEIINEPAELAVDSASLGPALVDAIEQVTTRDYVPDVLVCVQCTSPFTSPEDIDGTVQLLTGRSALDSALTVTRSHLFMWVVSEDGVGHGVNHDPLHRQLRQDRKPDHLETGAVYATRVSGLVETGSIRHGLVGLYEQPSCRVLEIDDPADLQRAELWAITTEQPGQS